MANTLEDQIWGMTIDVIQNAARDNNIRDEYDRLMSDRGYNNNFMNQLFDHIIKYIELGMPDCRNVREEDALIKDAIDESISQHIGVWITGDRQLANSIEDDRIWRDLEKSAIAWDQLEKDYDRASRSGGRGGRGGGRDNRDDGRDRNPRNSGLGYSQSRPPAGRDRSSGRDNTGGGRLSSGLAGAACSTQRQPEPYQERSPGVRQNNGLARTRQEPVRDVVEPSQVIDDMIDKNAGPDMSSDRPYDSFWLNGELWEMAHLSKMVWVWSAKQQFRRMYNPEEEVCFLVMGVNNEVREEFIPMNDDLNYAMNEIKANIRLNDTRKVKNRGGNDDEITMPGEDIDSVDLDLLNKSVAYVRREFLHELEINNAMVLPDPVISATVQDAAILTTRALLNSDKDVVASGVMVVQTMPSTGGGIDELVSMRSMFEGDAGLDALHKRLHNLRGKLDESIMDAIDKHYTAEINHTLKYTFEFGKMNIDSFMEDFPALMAAIAKKRTPAYAAQFLARTRNIVLTLVVQSGDGVCKDIIESIDILPEGIDDSEAYINYRNAAVMFMKPVAMLSVKVDAGAFGLLSDIPRMPAARGEGADPELYDALKGLYLQARKASGTGRIYLMTADNVMLELIASCGAKDIIGVRKL